MIIKPNIRLYGAIKEAGMTHRSFAKAVGEHESLVSRVVNGWANLDDAREERWARVLGRKVNEIFARN